MEETQTFTSAVPQLVPGLRRWKSGGRCTRRREPADASRAPEFHFDYCFLRNRPGGDQAKTVVGKERMSQGFVAHVVPSKGTGAEWVAQQLARDIRKFGCHGRVLIKTDGEPAIKSLARDVARARGDLPTVLENPPPSDSKANGYAERAVRSVEEQV